MLNYFIIYINVLNITSAGLRKWCYNHGVITSDVNYAELFDAEPIFWLMMPSRDLN